MKTHHPLAPAFLSLTFLAGFLFVWTLATMPERFDAAGYSAEELELMEMNGDIVPRPDGGYAANNVRSSGLPGPGDRKSVV